MPQIENMTCEEVAEFMREATQPVKIGLDYYRYANGALWVGNLGNVKRLAACLARKHTAQDRISWTPSVWCGVVYRRISFCAQKGS